MSPLIVQNNVFTRINGNTKVLQNGSSVLVRVIADKGDGKYEGSVAGSRITLNSKTPLKIGSTFIATINNQNGNIQIIPKGDLANNTEFSPQLNTLQSEQISSLLKAIGLPPDQISLNLLKQMQQLDMKLDFNMLQRFHNLALKFKGKEKSAAQLLVVLLKKGLNATDNEILQMLLEMDGDFDQQKQNAEDKEYSLINNVNKKYGDWSFYPFELVEYGSERLLGNGCIKILTDRNNVLKFLNVNCNYADRRYFFNLDYEGKKLKKVHVNVQGYEYTPDDAMNRLKTLFAKINASVEIVWEDMELLEGTGASLQEIYTFKGVM